MMDRENSTSITVIKNRLRTCQPENGQKFKNSEPQSKFIGSKKKSVGIPFVKVKKKTNCLLEYSVCQINLRILQRQPKEDHDF